MGNWGLLMIARTLFGGQYNDFCYEYVAFKHSAQLCEICECTVICVLPIFSAYSIVNRQPSKKRLNYLLNC